MTLSIIFYVGGCYITLVTRELNITECTRERMSYTGNSYTRLRAVYFFSFIILRIIAASDRLLAVCSYTGEL